MSTAITTETRVVCPSCGKKAKRVSPITLRALLKDDFVRDLDTGGRLRCTVRGTGDAGCQPISQDTGWRFCDAPNCDVVYFSEKGDINYYKSQLKVSVGVKETTGERPLCYCFGHTMASIKKKLLTTGRCDALDDIRAKMNDPGCHCETENPSGACCLGSVARGIKIAQQELEMSETTVETKATVATSPTNRGELIAKVGTVISAIMASACCWLPLVLLAVGVSGAGIAATLETYRPLFIVVTFGFLVAAFYFTYRPRKAAAAAGHGCCATEQSEAEACCAPANKQRFSLMAFNKVMLWLVTVMAVAFLFFPSYVGVFVGKADSARVSAEMNRTVVQIDGMTCEGCAAIAENAIREVPGVLAVEVDYQSKRAVVGTDACCPVPSDEILAALKNVGYHGSFPGS